LYSPESAAAQLQAAFKNSHSYFLESHILLSIQMSIAAPMKHAMTFTTAVIDDSIFRPRSLVSLLAQLEQMRDCKDFVSAPQCGQFVCRSLIGFFGIALLSVQADSH